MRLFIAIDIPEDHSKFLKELQSNLKKFRLTNEFHLTLKFLGDVEDPEKVIEALKKVKFNTFNLSYDSLGTFPDNARPRVVWIGFKDCEELMDLQKSISENLPEFADDYDYSPHLTLARVKHLSAEDMDFLKAWIEAQKVPEMSFKVDSFYLYKSVLKPEGPVYERLETFK